MQTTTLGYPRVGPRREYKWLLEKYWAGELAKEEFRQKITALKADRLLVQKEAGIDVVACGDFSLYDHVLDHALMFGCIPERFLWDREPTTDEDLLFAMARGKEGIPPCEMTKWFDTNYHYLVPELSSELRLTRNKPLEDLIFARSIGIPNPKPVILGAFSFLRLAKQTGKEFFMHLESLTSLYVELLRDLALEAPLLVQVDEPWLVSDISNEEWTAFSRYWEAISQTGAPLCLQTYYGDVEPIYTQVLKLPFYALGLDFVRGKSGNVRAICENGFPDDCILVAGVIDGRNVWRSNLQEKLGLVNLLLKYVPEEKLWIAPSCPLLHLPETVEGETHLEPALRRGLSFARERLRELVLLCALVDHPTEDILEQCREWESALQGLRELPGRVRMDVRDRLAKLTEADFRRPPLEERKKTQRAACPLPLLPTTTIGSFPQTGELRKARARAKASGQQEEYRQFLLQEVEKIIRLQEELGLDVLVHGEPERSDMVEFFSEQLEGFAATENGWVQSYGSRCVRPPLLYGDIYRRSPMTLDMSRYAQSLTSKPVKGILTGPVTMLKWSFVRDDLPEEEVAMQLALAIRDEVCDLERKGGIKIIQIDEPAFREGLPLRRQEWSRYFEWAVRAFRLTSSGVSPWIQIHTHMCYSEFGDILPAIAELDADVISIEDARSHGEMLEKLKEFQYPAGIGPGVYDIHSPNIPSVEFIAQKIRKTLEILPAEQVWVNPDCGLKTRRYEEVIPSLRNMVKAAHIVRAECASPAGTFGHSN